MPRKKIHVSYITNEAKRRATLKKRKAGLLKKMNEISTLCGIDACAIIYAPRDPRPEVWPSDSEVQRVVSRFKGMPEPKQSQKMWNQESLLKKMILKNEEQLKKQKTENRKNETALHMFQYLADGKIFNNLSLIDLNDLSWTIDQKLNEIEKKIIMLQIQQATSVMGNGGEAQAHMHHVQGLETNMDIKQNHGI